MAAGVGSSATLFTAFIELGYKGFEKVDSYMRKAVEAVNSGVKAIKNEAAGGENAILSFARAGSPLAFNTFAGSVELLKSRIGSAFTPVMLAAAKSLQTLSDWIKNLDPQIRKQIATWTAIGVAGAALIPIVWSLSKAFLGFAASIAIGALKHPMLTLLGMLATAALYAWNSLSKLEDKMKSMVETAQRLNRGDITSDDINSSYVGRDLNQTEDAEKRRKKAEQYIKIKEDRKRQLMSEIGDYGHGSGVVGQALNQVQSGYDATGIMSALNLPGGGQLQRQAEEMAELNRDIAISRQFSGTASVGARPNIRQSDPNLVMANMRNSPYASSGAKSLDSAYTNLNNMALGQDDIQRKILQEQIQANQQAMAQARNVTGIFDMLSTAVGR